MYIGVGSLTNVDDPDVNANEKDRATVIEFKPRRHWTPRLRTGVRNAVGLAFHPQPATVVSVNERDDSATTWSRLHHPRSGGGFYGWPYYYMGGTQDPRHLGNTPS